MTSIYETTDRLIIEQLDVLLAAAWHADDLLRAELVDHASHHEQTARFVRLACAVRSLYQRHQIDRKGRCRICTRRRWLRRQRTQPCTVYAALNFFLTQPDEFVFRAIPDQAGQSPVA